MKPYQRNIALVIVLAFIIGAIVYFDSGNKFERNAEIAATSAGNIIPVPASVTGTSTASASSLPGSSAPTPTAKGPETAAQDTARIKTETAEYSRAKELITPDGFINTGGPNNNAPVTLSQYIGKDVVLLDVWTYSCINCQRTIPHLNALYQKYKGDGFVIIGLSVPEFDFEKNYDNVANAVKQLGIKYPVVLDNKGTTAAEYGMQYWPEDWLINIDGFIVDHHIGEGDYDAQDALVAKYVAERDQVLGVTGAIDTSAVDPASSNNPTVSVQNESPETYFGAYRNEYFANGTQGETGLHTFTEPSASSILPDQYYLGGEWNIETQDSESAAAGASITYEYTSNNVFFVAGSGNAAEAPVKAELFLDGKALGSRAGTDVTNTTDAQGVAHSYVTIGGNRLYRLVSDSVSGTHVLKIVAQGAGLQAFTFTFGADMAAGN